MVSTELVVVEDLFSVEKFDSMLLKKAVSFIGSLSKHPYEDNKFILIMDPISDHTEFIEFIRDDVVYIEELPSLLTNNDESVSIKKVWIREGSMGLKMQPFLVAKTKSRTFLS